MGISRYVMSEVRATHWTAEWLCLCLGPEGMDTGALALASALDRADSGPWPPWRQCRARGRGLCWLLFPSCVHAYSK